MEYITLFNGKKIEKYFFENRLEELKKEKWQLRDISELNTDHVDCDLTFETISKKSSTAYYESNNYSCITVDAYNYYIKKI